MARSLTGIPPYAPRITPTQFEPCDLGCYPAGKFHLRRQTCKGADNPQLYSNSPETSWFVIQLKAQALPMKTPLKLNTATICLFMT